MQQERNHSKEVSIPHGLEDLESEFQRMIYVESRISQLSTLKHDRLMLKERFLQALVPPDVQKGFSQEINELVLKNQSLTQRIHSLTSQLDRLRNGEDHPTYEKKCDNRLPRREYEESDSEPPVREKRIPFLFVAILVVILVSALYGWTHGISCSPSPVDSGPVGVEHSMKGGTTNGTSYQPN